MNLSARLLAAWSGGGFDVVKAKIPEPAESSGQCDSVTGSLLYRDHLSGVSIGSEASRATSAQLPPHSGYPIRHNPSVAEGPCAIPPSPPSSPSLPATDAAFFTCDDHTPESSTPSTAHDLLASGTKLDSLRTFQRSAAIFPDTPEATPSSQVTSRMNGVKRDPCVDLKAYVQTVLPDLISIETYLSDGQSPYRYMLEDAVMESIDSQWSGVVLIDTRVGDDDSRSERRQVSKGMSRSDNCDSWHSTSSQSSNHLQLPENYRTGRTLLTKIDSKHSAGSNLRRRVLSILDHAAEVLRADSIIFAVDRTAMDAEHFRSTVHGLCYVGASIMRRSSTASQSAAMSIDCQRFPEESLTSPRSISPQFVLLSMSI